MVSDNGIVGKTTKIIKAFVGRLKNGEVIFLCWVQIQLQKYFFDQYENATAAYVSTHNYVGKMDTHSLLIVYGKITPPPKQKTTYMNTMWK